jgi:hypothetical protein
VHPKQLLNAIGTAMNAAGVTFSPSKYTHVVSVIDDRCGPKKGILFGVVATATLVGSSTGGGGSTGDGSGAESEIAVPSDALFEPQSPCAFAQFLAAKQMDQMPVRQAVCRAGDDLFLAAGGRELALRAWD